MAETNDIRVSARDDDVDQEELLRELVTYQSWTEVEMLEPRLEDDEIPYEVREVNPTPAGRSDGVEPRVFIQILVPRGQLRHAREVLQDFEAQRDVTTFEARPSPEPEDIGRPDDMSEPPQPKMKF